MQLYEVLNLILLILLINIQIAFENLILLFYINLEICILRNMLMQSLLFIYDILFFFVFFIKKNFFKFF